MTSGKKDATSSTNTHNDAGVTYRVGDDGSWEAETDLGKLTIDAAGNLKAVFDSIKAICIGDLTSIRTYQIDDKGETISHEVCFRNGGSFRIAYTTNGEIVDFRVGRLRIRISHDKVLTLNPVD